MQEGEEEEEDDDEGAAAMMPIRGPLPPQDGSWASCVRLLDPVEGATVECLELGEFFVASFPFKFSSCLGCGCLRFAPLFLGSPLLSLVSSAVGCPLPWPQRLATSATVLCESWTVLEARFCAPSGSSARLLVPGGE